MTEQQSSSVKDEAQLVTFLLGNEEFGFDIMSVQEIIRPPKLARIPRAPQFVDGIANLRGAILPVIDVRTRFELSRTEDTDRTRVLVVDIEGVKTGLRVDRVSQVARFSQGEIEQPPSAIRGRGNEYLNGVVKLDGGNRIIMSLDAARVCKTGIVQGTGETSVREKAAATQTANTGHSSQARQMVSFLLAGQEFAFAMENVREILRVVKPKQVPDVPQHVLGVLTLRGSILPIIDLRTLLRQESLASEFTGRCAHLRSLYADWVASESWAHPTAAEELRTWLAEFNSSSQVLMESLSLLRVQNEKVLRECSYVRKDKSTSLQELRSATQEVLAGLLRLENQIEANMHEDQRIIVVDAGGHLLGLVVDCVREVLNVPFEAIEPAPKLGEHGQAELSGIAKLNDGTRLVMLLGVEHLLSTGDMERLASSKEEAVAVDYSEFVGRGDESGVVMNEIQLVTFLLGMEEYGLPISQIQEIDRLSKLTRVPKAPNFVEGITNLRGEVIPVLNTRTLFEMESNKTDDRTRIIIVELDGVKTGLIVDSVKEVLSLQKSDIAPPPTAVRKDKASDFISGIGKANSGKRMIVLLDVNKILNADQQGALSEVKAEG